MICEIIGGYMLAKTLVVFYVWSPDIFVLFFLSKPNFWHCISVLCQMKHYHILTHQKFQSMRMLIMNYIIIQYNLSIVRSLALLRCTFVVCILRHPNTDHRFFIAFHISSPLLPIILVRILFLINTLKL